MAESVKEKVKPYLQDGATGVQPGGRCHQCHTEDSLVYYTPPGENQKRHACCKNEDCDYNECVAGR